MTMDNGDGRPLDEEEAGPDDPQGWYFDLPGGAWERQEEKNRTLRQRVLGNFEEDAEKSKGDPFAKKFELRPQPEPTFELRRPEPEQKKRGLFGFGKKKDQEGVEERGPGDTLEFDESDEEWSTEPPLTLSPFPRAERDESRAPWGDSDGGWDLGARKNEEEDEFVSGLKAWAHRESGDGAEPGQEPAVFEPVAEAEPESWPATPEPVAETEPEAWPAVFETEPVDATDDESDFAARIRAWADAPEAVEAEIEPPTTTADETPEATDAFTWTVTEPQVEAPKAEVDLPVEWTTSPEATSFQATDEDEVTPPETLLLRPRPRQDDGKSLDWNFGPAAWRDREEEPAATAGDEDDDSSALESMRKWAERNKDKDHPHFTTAHAPDDAELPPVPAPIPLRPRHQDESQPVSQFAPAAPEDRDGEESAPPSLPIRLRSRTEPEETPARPAPDGGSSKWDDFFSISPSDASAEAGDSDGEGDGSGGEGLSAMRAWAQKRPEPDAPRDIPEEFLKPFDWELHEDTPTGDDGSPAPIPAEFLKPFDWEEKPQAGDESVPATAEDDDWSAAGDDGTADAPEPLQFPVRAFEAVQFAPEEPVAAADEDEDDPLAGLFERPEMPVATTENKKGRFGRLFGRGKDKRQPEPLVEDSVDHGDWLLPGEAESSDVRNVASSDWADDGGTAQAAQFDEEVPATGWGAARGAAWTESDGAAIEEFASAVSLPGGDPDVTAEFEVPSLDDAALTASPVLSPLQDEWKPEPSAPDAAAQADAFEAERAASAPEDAGGWDPEPVVPAPIAGAFSWLSTGDSNDEPTSEPTAEAVASLDESPEPAETPWWEAASEGDAPASEPTAEAVASLDEGSEPAAEKAWWEAASEGDEPASEPTVEAVASLDEHSEPAAEKAWWEAAGAGDELASGPTAEAVASVDESPEPAETPWWEAASAEDAPASEPTVEAVASVDESPEPAETPWWEAASEGDEAASEPVAEAVASVEEAPEPAAEKAWWEAAGADEPLASEVTAEAVASVDEAPEPAADKAWWEAASEGDEPASDPTVEAVASVEEAPEPAAEKAWWEAASEGGEAASEPAAEAVASVEGASEPAAAKAWWDAASQGDEPASEPAAEAVGALDQAPEPAADKAWWEAASADDEGASEVTGEAVGALDQAPEPAAEKAWREAASADDESASEPIAEAVASVEEAPEPTAETAWWEAASEGDEPASDVTAEAVASVEEAPEPAETPWWEAASEGDEPTSEPTAEAVASVEDASEPAAAKAWWEAASQGDEPASEPTVEAVPSVEEAPEAAPEKAWWEAASADDEPASEPTAEAVASVEEAPEPAADKAWWEAASEGDEAASEVPAEAVASLGESPEAAAAEDSWAVVEASEDPGVPEIPGAAAATIEQPAADKPWWQKAAEEIIEPEDTAAAMSSAAPIDDDDDPWADFVSRPAATEPPPPPSVPSTWTATPSAPRDEDMWGDIAASAEAAAGQAPHDIDIAASLESQMAEQEPATSYSWNQPPEDDGWDAAPAITAEPPIQSEDEEDVILAAFERHAATPESPAARREQDEAFAELLGEQAADIVAEASEEDGNERSFIRMSGWAPQRGTNDFDGGWAPQQDVEDTLARGQRPFSFGGVDGDGFAPPSWAVDDMEPDEAPIQQRGHKTKTWIREIVETGLLAFLVFLSVRASFQNFKVEGSSMSPTLEDGQFLIVNKLVYSEVDMDKLGKYVPFIDGGADPERNVFHGPERGDIVVLVDPRNPETDLIKRVIGLPGESVEIVDGKVYINDHLLEEPYIESVWHDTRPKILVPPDEYFVMGDNRDNSLDSRNSQVSTVPKDLIIGKAMLSYWPSEKFGLAPNDSPELTDEKPVLTTQRIDEE